MLGMIFDQAKVDIPRKSLSFILIGTFFDRFGARMLVIYDEDDSAKVFMENTLSSIMILTLLLTKPVGTVMDKASVLEVFRYRSSWLLYDLVSLLYRITNMAITNEKDHNMKMLKV